MSRWACNFAGECEEQTSGRYATREECQANCQAVADKDVLYIIATYNLSDVLHLAPSDQRRVIKEYTGVHVPVDLQEKYLRHILFGLDAKVYPYLVRWPFLRDWVREQVSQEEWWAVQLLDSESQTYKLSWQLLTLELDYSLQRFRIDYAVRYDEFFYQRLRQRIVDFVAHVGTIDQAPRIEEVLRQLWPEMKDVYLLK